VLLLTASGCGLSAKAGVDCLLHGCAAGLHCDAQLGACVSDLAPDAGGTCADDKACPSTAPRCLVAEARCVACLRDTDCSVGACDPDAHACAPLPDSCTSGRAPVDLSAGVVTLHGSTARASDDTRLSCALSGSLGADLVYPVQVPSSGRLTATVAPDDGAVWRPVLALRSLCAEVSSEVGLGCAYADAAGPATLVVEGLRAGTYFLWVDSETEATADFTLSLRFEPTPAPDACLSAMSVVADPELVMTGDVSALADDFASTCGGAGLPDAVYALTLSQTRRVRLDVTGLGGFLPVVSVRSACSDAASEVGCAALADASGTAVLELPALGAGTWFVIIDGLEGTTPGRFSLHVTTALPILPPTNDSCSSAQVLSLPSQELGRVSTQGDTAPATNDSLGCGGTGPDIVYAFTLTQAREVSVRVTPLAGSTYRPVVYLRREGGCDSELLTDQVFCATASQPGFPAGSLVPRLEPGTWYLWVDGAAGSAGPFDLVLDLARPPPVPANDSCAAPAAVSLAAGAVTLTGTTLGALDDATTCESGHAPDVVYDVEVPSTEALAVDLRGASGSAIRPVVSLRPEGLCSATLPLGALTCSPSDPQVTNRTVAFLPALAAGHYSLWVDGDSGTQGAFSLRLVPGPALTAVPANDGCSGALLPSLVVGQSLTGDTRAATNDVGGGCNLPAGAGGERAPDVAYAFTLSAPRSVSFTVTPDAVDGALLRPVISVRAATGTACTSTGPVKGCAAAPDYGAPVTSSFTQLPAGTYTVWVDGAGSSSGRFSLSAQ
jgi:hypothetical protein